MKAPFAKCDECSLKENIFVPSEIHKSRICLLGEAPGYYETKDGRPFTGVAGADLNRIIEELDAKREDFNYLNAVSCRPTYIDNGRIKNRTPTNEEIKYCNERLIVELEELSPIVIVAMGKIPYVALGGSTKVLMRDVAGTHFVWRNKFDVYVTYHPAAISHSGGINTTVGKLTRDKIKEQLAIALKAEPKDKQLKLFE
jgi:uracil-DNA glycosylase